MDEVKLSKITGCQAPCSRWEYSSTTVLKKDVGIARGIGSRLKLDIFYANGNYQEKLQFYTYGMNDLFSDLGSFLGLFLGASLLTFYDVMASLHAMCTKLFFKKK